MFTFDLQLFAHKKGVSSTRNGRDSESKRLGVKCHDGSIVKSANKVSSLPIPTLVPGWK